jgi:hypothetical protein
VRYGLIPSDTYSHWIVRRLLSFSSNLKYWGESPYERSQDVKKEFLGADFYHFMAAIKVRTKTYRRDRGSLNRRVEIRVLDAGGCDPNK